MTIGLTWLALKCGSIHGSPRCGPLSIVPSLIVVAALVIESTIFSVPQSDAVVNIIVVIVALIIVVSVVGVLCLWKASRGDAKRDGKSP